MKVGNFCLVNLEVPVCHLLQCVAKYVLFDVTHKLIIPYNNFFKLPFYTALYIALNDTVPTHYYILSLSTHIYISLVVLANYLTINKSYEFVLKNNK